MQTVAQNALGNALDSALIQRGLKELNKDFAFDVAVNRASEWESVVQFPNQEALEAMRKNRMPVMYHDRYICGLDRGMVPEFKQWSVREQLIEMQWADADKEGCSIQWVTVMPDDPEYIDLYLRASVGGDPSLQIMAGGQLVRQRVVGYAKVRGRVVTLGWRHTFERLIAANIDGVTRQSISQKFNVDMLKYPVGPPDELIAALVEE